MINRIFKAIVFAIIGLSSALSSSAIAEYAAGARAFGAKDYVKARLEFEESAKEDHKASIFLLAKIYNEGLGTSRDPKRAYELYKRLAEMGDSTAMIQLGDMTLDGAALPAKFEDARVWYMQAAAKGNTEGYCRMAKLYEPDPGNAGDPQEMARLLQKAAEEIALPASKCAIQSRRQLARLYVDGVGVPKSPCMSIKFRGELAADGAAAANWIGAGRRARDPELQFVIISMIVSQYNRTNNSSIGKDGFVKAVLSDIAEPYRTLLLALLTKNGLGIQRDLVASARLADEAIAKMDDEKQGNDMSMKERARWFYDFDLSCLQLTR